MSTKKTIKAGYSFLYREGGTESEIIEIVLIDRVKRNILQAALDKAVTRHPYLRNSVVEEQGDFRLKNNSLPLTVSKTPHLRPLGGKEVNYHLIDITCWDNRIFVAFHHGLCDGRGIFPFIEMLLYAYLTARYRAKIQRPGGRYAGQNVGLHEWEDPFAHEPYHVEESTPPRIVRDGFALPEVQSGTGFHKCSFVFKADHFMEHAKACGATPAIYVALLLQQTIKQLNPGADKPIVCSMASDLRQALGHEGSFKNCVSSLYLPYDNEIEQLPRNEQTAAYRRMIREQKEPNHVRRTANGMISLFNRLDGLTTFEERQQQLAFFNDMLINTFVLSYVGQFDLKGCEPYVHEAHLYCSGSKGMMVNMLSIGNSISIEIEQSFADPRYCQGLCRCFDAEGLQYEYNSPAPFETPKDVIQSSLLMSRYRSKGADIFIRLMERIEHGYDKIEYSVAHRYNRLKRHFTKH